MEINGKELDNLKIKPWIIELIPWLGPNTIQAIYPNIYIPKIHMEKYLIKNPNKYFISNIIHEFEHIKRQKELGLFKWILKYLLSSKFRLEEELLADVSKMKYLKENNLDFNIPQRSRMLSGWNYFWPDSFENIQKKLIRIWDEI